VAACTFNEINVPKTVPGVVVHAVLYGGATDQVVLVERTLTGAVNIPDSQQFNPDDPILSDRGVPILNAVVEIAAPAGQVYRAVAGGPGVYRVPLTGASLQPGGIYTLRIHTPDGDDVSATTTVPGGRPSTGESEISFNRDRDTLDIRWKAVPQTRSYALRIEGPFGPFFLFNDSLHFRFNGELRNLFTEGLPRVFIPGFRQQLLVAAIDSNFYDYYRTQNDPFTGSGIISRVKGGIGFFGSLMPVIEHAVNVTADVADSVEGRFVYRALPGQTGVVPATDLSIYVESKSIRSGAPNALSGNYTSGGSRQTRGLLGKQLGKSVTLALLLGQADTDTAAVFTGELRGDSLIGNYRNRTGTFTFVKSR